MRYSTVKLGDVVKLDSGFAFKSKLFGDKGGLPLARIRDVVPGFSHTRYLGEYDEKYLINDGDMLIGMDGEFNLAKWRGGKALLNQRVCRVRGDAAHVLDDFLYYFLPRKLKEIEAKTPAVTVKHLSVKTIREIDIPLPGKKEQKRIVAALGKADAIRRKRQQAIDLADEFLRSAFLDFFGDPSANPNNYPVNTIESLLASTSNAIRTGPFGSQLKHSEFSDSGVPVLGIDNIVTNQFRWTSKRFLEESKYQNFKRYRVFPEDLVITIMGTTGRVAVAPADLPECMSTKHLCVVTLNRTQMDPYFLWATIRFDKAVRAQASVSSGGAIMEGWNMGTIKSLKVRVPPLEQQKQFRKVFFQVSKVKNLQVKSRLTDEELFGSLSQRAFSGEL